MTYTEKTIDELLKEPLPEERKLVLVKGQISTPHCVTIHDLQEIGFALHFYDPHQRRSNAEKNAKYVLITFRPQENEVAQVLAALASQHDFENYVRVMGEYYSHNENKFIIGHEIRIKNLYFGSKQLEEGSKYTFTAEGQTRRIVEKVD